MTTIKISLGRQGQLQLERIDPRVRLILPDGRELWFSRPQAWALAEALDTLATAAESNEE